MTDNQNTSVRHGDRRRKREHNISDHMVGNKICTRHQELGRCTRLCKQDTAHVTPTKITDKQPNGGKGKPITELPREDKNIHNLALCGRIKCSRSRRGWSYLKMADFTRGRFSALSLTSYLPLSAYFCLAVLFLMLFSNNNLKVQLLRNKCITSSRSHHNIKLTKSATIICSLFQYGIF